MKQKLLAGVLSVGFLGTFALATPADAGFGKIVKKVGGAVSKVAKVVKPFVAPALAMTPAGGVLSGLSALKGIKKGGGLSGILKGVAGSALKATPAGKFLGQAKQMIGKGKQVLGKVKEVAGKAKALKGKGAKFAKLGKGLMKPGGVTGLVGKFAKQAKAGPLKGGPFSLIGKMTKGSGLAAPFKGFLGGKRAGQLNKLRGMTGFMAGQGEKGGKGLEKLGKFSKRLSGHANMRKEKAGAAIKGVFGKLKGKLKLTPAQQKHLDEAQAEASEEAVAQVDMTAQAAVEAKAEEEITAVDPAAGAAAEADPGVPAAVSDDGEPKNEASAEPEASADAQEGVAAAAEEAGAPAPAPAADEEAAE